LVMSMSAPIDMTPETDAPSTRGDGSLWADPHDDGDLGDMLQELRVLLPGSQTLTAFLVILPFNSGFSQIQDEERYVYLAAFLCSLLSLILFTAPAAHHRIQRPLRDRAQFKTISTRLMVAGLVPLSAALVLSTQLAISQVIPEQWVSLICAGAVLVVIIIVWWSYPIWRQR
jgi:hypothetical protein